MRRLYDAPVLVEHCRACELQIHARYTIFVASSPSPIFFQGDSICIL